MDLGCKYSDVETGTQHPMADRIEQLMSDMGFDNQIAMAKAVGVNPETVSIWKSGRPIGPGNMARLAYLRQCAVAELKAFADDGTPLPPMRQSRHTPPLMAALESIGTTHPCPALGRFMEHCYRNNIAVAEAMITAMMEYVDARAESPSADG